MRLVEKVSVLTSIFATTLGFVSPPAFASCATKIEHPSYAAQFDWKNAATGKNQKRKILLGRSKKGAMIAQIWSGTSCQASCKGAGTQMQCRSSEFSPFSTPVTLLRDQGQLRFGTWLQGYEYASLKVTENVKDGQKRRFLSVR